MSSKAVPISPEGVSPEGEKIVTAHAMAEMERLAIVEKDASPDEYMQRAADGIYKIVKQELFSKSIQQVTLLCAKGNNSGDAYSVGERLLKYGIKVLAYQVFPLDDCSTLCQKHLRQFQEKGGKVVFLTSIDQLKLDSNGIILDGLLGTGFKGSVQGLLQASIDAANKSNNRVIAIDIPSGVPGDTGAVEGSAIVADLTIYLGMLKVGHFYNNGFEYVGDFIGVDFGISQKYKDAIEPFAYLVNPEVVKRNIPKRKRTANKYTVGQGIALAGSFSMPGAAILAAKAALRSGIGIIKLFHPPGMEAELSTLPPEVIRTPYENQHMEGIFQELKRTRAVLVGPGLGRSEKIKEMLKLLYREVTCPIVIDADALYFFEKVSMPAILTPHEGEVKQLLKIQGPISNLELIQKAQQFVDEKNVVMVFKGAPTTVLAPHKPKIVIPYGNPGMASGGMGDALSGILLALLAQGMETRDAAILGAAIHGLAGDVAKEKLSISAMTASDLIEALPSIFKSQSL